MKITSAPEHVYARSTRPAPGNGLFRITNLFGVLLCLAFLTPSDSFSQQGDFDEVEIVTHKVTPSIYMLEGKGGNIGICIGEDGVFMIDDQFAPLTEKITNAIDNLSDSPVEFVINTHYHHDHVGGNENLGKTGSVIISHHNSREDIFADQLKKATEAGRDGVPAESLPIITFSDNMTFHYNDQTINVFHVKNAHTDGDVVVHFQKANVIHAGDVFVRYGFPYIDIPHGGSINGMIDALEQLSALADNHTKIIPGHGDISTKKDLVDFKNWLTNLRDAVKREMNQGKSKEQIQTLNPIKPYIDSDADAENVISTIFDSLKNR